MKKSIASNIKYNWMVYLIILQPILDIIAYFELLKQDGMTIAFIIRSLILLIITLYVFIKTLIYGIIEIKQEKNIYGGSATILIGILALILPNIIIHFR